MADFGGFQIKTPQEVLAELAAQQQAIATLPANQRRNANIQFQMANLFGNPELQKARTLEKNMKLVNDEVAKQTGGRGATSLDDERKRMSMMFDAVKDLDPVAASQIQSRLTELDEAVFQREQLRARSERADRSIDVQERNVALQEAKFRRTPDFSGYGFLVDPTTDEPVAYDLGDPARNKEYQDRINNGALPMTQAQAAELLGKNQTRDLMKAEFNKSAHERKVAQYRADITFMDKASKLINVFRRDQGAGTVVNNILRGTGALLTESRAAVDKMFAPDGSKFNQSATERVIKEKLNAIEDFALPEGISRGRFESMILNMGYVLARSLDSGGRLSDQDVNMAISMLTGGSIGDDATFSINPKVIVSVLLQNAADKYDMVAGPLAIDPTIFTEARAQAGDQQSRTIRSLMAITEQGYNQVLEQARQVLTKEEIKAVIDPFNAPTLAEERADAARAEAREKVADMQSRTPTNTIDRGGAPTIAAKQGDMIIMGADGTPKGSVTPATLKDTLRNLKEGERVMVLVDGQWRSVNR